jgi:hypothetical protein
LRVTFAVDSVDDQVQICVDDKAILDVDRSRAHDIHTVDLPKAGAHPFAVRVFNEKTLTANVDPEGITVFMTLAGIPDPVVKWLTEKLKVGGRVSAEEIRTVGKELKLSAETINAFVDSCESGGKVPEDAMGEVLDRLTFNGLLNRELLASYFAGWDGKCEVAYRGAEGWHYTLRVLFEDKVLDTFDGGEDRPQRDGPHHGKWFAVAKGMLDVDVRLEQIHLVDVDKNLWKTFRTTNHCSTLGW